MKASLGSIEVALGALAVGAGLYLLWTKGGAAVDAIKNGALNPANPENIVNKTVTDIVNQQAGGPPKTIGARVWEAANPQEAEAERQMTLPILRESSAALLFGNDLERLSARGRIYASQSVADAEFAQGAPFDLTPGGM